MPFSRRASAALSVVAISLLLASTSSPSSASGAKAVATPGPSAVGALFSLTPAGTLGSHFCTASVVDSPSGNVVITAAHCLTAHSPTSLAFVPGYHDGTAPLGIWKVTKAYTDPAWTSSADPDHDVAFLVVAARGARTLEQLTGAERLATTRAAAGKQATVVGYPAAADSTISCTNVLHGFSTTQLEFDCRGYTNGTSGSALIVDPDPTTGLGAIVGVIGGYQEGGDTADVSYAAALGGPAATLYRLAAAAGRTALG